MLVGERTNLFDSAATHSDHDEPPDGKTKPVSSKMHAASNAACHRDRHDAARHERRRRANTSSTSGNHTRGPQPSGELHRITVCRYDEP